MVKNSTHLNRYVAAVTTLGVVACGCVLLFGTHGAAHLGEVELLIFALCALLGELVPLKVYTRGAEGETTTSTTFAVALLIAGGIEAALVGLLVGNLIADLVRRKPAHKIAFNMAQYAISVVVAGAVLSLLSEVPRDGEFHFVSSDLPAIMIASLVFFVVNTSLVAAVIAMVEGVGIWRYLVTDWFSQASTTGLMLGLSPIVVLAADYSLPLVTLLFLPLFAIHRGGRAAIAKEHQALHDALTGLPNRALFRDRVAQAIDTGRRSGQGCSVMLMDLDHFKEINDTLGHYQGDRLLQEVAARLRIDAAQTATRSPGWAATSSRSCSRRSPTPCRPRRSRRPAGRGCASRSRSTRLTLEVGGSIGVACYPEHGDDGETLIQRADIAMYAAKNVVERPRGVRGQPGPSQSAQRLRARRRAAPRDRAHELVLALPAQGRRAHRQDRRRRGAVPLGAPDARARSCRPSSSRWPSRPA